MASKSYVLIARLMFIFVISLGVGGCAGAGQTYDPPPAPQPPAPHDDVVPNVFDLTIVGWQNLVLEQGQQVTLQVRYTKNQQSVVDAPVVFRFIGNAKDMALSTFTAMTNSQGYAETVLTAGQLLGKFQIETQAAQSPTARWDVEVQKKPEIKPVAPKLAGSFTVSSQFDIQTQFSGTKVGDVLTLINDISDDPEDPGKFVVDTVLSNVKNDAVLAVANFIKPALYVEVNKLLNNIAPTFVAQIKQLAQDLSTIARKFEMVSDLYTPVPQDSDKPMTVQHTLKRLAWNLYGKRVEYTFAQLGLSDPVANGVVITPANTVDFGISQHSFDLEFGSFILVALNNLVLPHIQPNAQNVTDLIMNQLDCDKVGQTMNDTVKLGGQSLWTSACTVGLKVVGAYIESKIVNLDQETSKLTINGQMKLLDKNQDGFIESLDNGIWSGSFELSSSVAPIVGQNNSFSGAPK